MSPTLQVEIDHNFDAFQRQVGGYVDAHNGEFALLRGGKVVNFFPTVREAEEVGVSKFHDGLFSIQEVTVQPADLGFFTHAYDQG